ncbi:MAG: uncharacterized protein JWO94_1569 [Verrucomicrobiaceae bacterium]|nr:uncharacterized protein [Verrucomicrobiaceae bacterium]
MTKTTLQRRLAPFEHGFTLLELVVVVAILVVMASVLIVKVDKVRVGADDTVTRATLNTVREAIMGSAGGPGYLSDMKYVPGFDPIGIQLGDLIKAPSYLPLTAQVYDPIARRGWRGPYLDNVQPVSNLSDPRGLFPSAGDQRFAGDPTFFERHFYSSSTSSFYGAAGDLTIADHWGNPLVIQIPPSGVVTPDTDAERLRYARIVSAGADGRLDTPRDRLAGMQPDGTINARGDDLVIFLNRPDVYEP